jgi:hypothetical protein
MCLAVDVEYPLDNVVTIGNLEAENRHWLTTTG